MNGRNGPPHDSGRPPLQRVQIGSPEPQSQLDSEPEEENYESSNNGRPFRGTKRSQIRPIVGGGRNGPLFKDGRTSWLPIRGKGGFAGVRSRPQGSNTPQKSNNRSNQAPNRSSPSTSNSNPSAVKVSHRSQSRSRRFGRVKSRGKNYRGRGGSRGGGYVKNTQVVKSKGKGKGHGQSRSKVGNQQRKNKTAFAMLKSELVLNEENMEPNDLIKWYEKIKESSKLSKIYDDMTEQLKNEINLVEKGNQKNINKAKDEGSRGQASLAMSMVAVKQPNGPQMSIKLLQSSIQHFTNAICQLPAPEQGVEQTELEKTTHDLYNSRAQAYSLLHRSGDYWTDALVALSLCTHSEQMKLVTTLVKKRIQQVKQNAYTKKVNGQNVSDSALKKWQEEVRANLKRAEDFLLLQAILDQQNDNKLNRLMASYMQIAQLRKERMVEGDRVKKQPQTHPNAQEQATPKTPMVTNIFESKNVTVTTNSELKARKQFKKNQVIFYEQVIAFANGSASRRNMLTRHCSNCFRQISVAKAVPCFECAEAVFCNDGCREFAKESDKHMRSCKIAKQVRAKLSKNSYLAFQLLCYTGIYYFKSAIQKGHRINELFISANLEKEPSKESESGKSKAPKIGYWPIYAVISAIHKRTDDVFKDTKNIKDRRVTVKFAINKEDTHILADALYLTHLLKPLDDKHLSSPIDENDALNVVYGVLWIVHHDPLANSRLGKNKDFAIGPFGSLLRFSCKPNVKRKFNPKKGRLEYQAMADIQEGDVLTVGWGSLLYSQERAKRNVTAEAGNEPATRSMLIQQRFCMKHDSCSGCPRVVAQPQVLVAGQ